MAEEYTTDELAEWFRSKASATASGQTARAKIFGATKRSYDTGLTGKLYVFKYDAKTRDKLEMWDKYPLCMVLERQFHSFMGLNLHYLPRAQRMSLLQGYDKYDEESEDGVISGKGTSNWELFLESMNNSGLGALPKKCLRRYLMTHVRSKFVEIYPDEFGYAIQLPIDLWSFKNI